MLEHDIEFISNIDTLDYSSNIDVYGISSNSIFDSGSSFTLIPFSIIAKAFRVSVEDVERYLYNYKYILGKGVSGEGFNVYPIEVPSVIIGTQIITQFKCFASFDVDEVLIGFDFIRSNVWCNDNGNFSSIEFDKKYYNDLHKLICNRHKVSDIVLSRNINWNIINPVNKSKSSLSKLTERGVSYEVS